MVVPLVSVLLAENPSDAAAALTQWIAASVHTLEVAPRHLIRYSLRSLLPFDLSLSQDLLWRHALNGAWVPNSAAVAVIFLLLQGNLHSCWMIGIQSLSWL